MSRGLLFQVSRDYCMDLVHVFQLRANRVAQELMTRRLEQLRSPSDISKLNNRQLLSLCRELRDEIIGTVAETGGHLGASLGVVEITVALHRVFNSPQDKIIWDVGHQAYGHKLLTGRLDRFSTLRQKGGISGFPKRTESEHDMFGVGHASTSISAALGYAKARDIKGGDNSVIAVIGDGALTGGLAFEGLNNAGQSGTNMIVILNDNNMSISPNVGAISRYLTRITSGQLYTRFEADIWKLLGKLPKGALAQKLAGRIKEGLKQIIVPTIIFEEFGFKYFGPIDGHDLSLVSKTLRSVKKLKGPILVHMVTTKGKGYAPAEQERVKYHGVGKFDRANGVQPSSASIPSYTDVFSDSMLAEAERDDRVVAVTAAMPGGTGLSAFREKYPERFFDVGIAEGHAVTFAAGLACDGLRPVVAIYSTFLQRCYDQIIHDVALQKLPVVFAVDRGGVVGEDGPTHHGVFDMSYLRVIPNLVVAAPRDENELRRLLRTALLRDDGPMALRYPRGAGVGVELDETVEPIPIGKGEQLRHGDDIVILAAGSTVASSMAAAEILSVDGIEISVVDLRFIKPLDDELLASVFRQHSRVVTVEENSLAGGLGSAILEWREGRDDVPHRPVTPVGIRDEFVEHATRAQLLDQIGLSAERLAARIHDLVRQGNQSMSSGA